MELDLDRYARRIGLDRLPAPDLDGLRRLAFAHATHIPFENFAAWLGHGVDLSLPAVERKLVDEGRGGWCFEQNLLFGTVLRQMGVEVTDHAARVLWFRPPGHRAPRTHRLLVLQIDGQPHVADVGFGVVTLSTVLPLVPDVEQATPHELHRFVRDGTAWRLEALLDDNWQPLYGFTLEPWTNEDFEPVNYQLSRDPASGFVRGLALARATPTGRLTLRDLDFTRRERGIVTESRKLASLAGLVDLVEGEFGIRCRDLDGLAARCAPLFAAR
jgi:N-hydroxyarylamine O-acetyltransferase